MKYPTPWVLMTPRSATSRCDATISSNRPSSRAGWGRLLVTPERAKGGNFIDGTEHRQSLPAAYNRYTEVGADPFYQARFEDVQMLIKPLFMTSFLIDDFLSEHAFFGARAACTSA
jgi:hypothetical protein